MAISAQELNVILTARDREFTRAMAAAERRVAKFQQQSNQGLGSVAGSFAMVNRAAAGLLPALSVGAVVAQVRRVVSEVSRIDVLAQIAGTTAEEFQRFAAGAETVGFQMDKTADVIKDVNDKIGDFLATGAGPMADFFENIAPKVGVTAEQFRNLSGQDALALYVQSLERANLSQAEMTFYMEALANDATALIPLLSNNAAEMKRLGDEAQEAGRIFDNEMVASAREAEIKLSQMAGEIRDNLSRALVDLAPLLITGSELISNFARNVSILMDMFNGPSIDEQLGNLIGQQQILDERIAAARASTPNPESNPAVASMENEWRRVTNQITELIERKRELEDQGEPDIAPSPETVPSLQQAGNAATTAGRAAVQAQEQFETMFDRIIAANPALASLGVTAEALGETMRGVEGTMESAFMSMVEGTMTAKDAFRAMAADIIRELYRVLVVQQMVGSMEGGTGIMGALGRVFSGRASGGSVMAGQPYTVGEHGRETFVPAQNGRILSTAQAKSAISPSNSSQAIMRMAQASNRSPQAQQVGLEVVVTMDRSTGALGAFVKDQAGRVLQQAAPRLIEASKMAVLEGKNRGGAFGQGLA